MMLRCFHPRRAARGVRSRVEARQGQSQARTPRHECSSTPSWSRQVSSVGSDRSTVCRSNDLSTKQTRLFYPFVYSVYERLWSEEDAVAGAHSIGGPVHGTRSVAATLRGSVGSSPPTPVNSRRSIAPQRDRSFAERLDAIEQDGERVLVLGNYGTEAWREAIDERRRMLGDAAEATIPLPPRRGRARARRAHDPHARSAGFEAAVQSTLLLGEGKDQRIRSRGVPLSPTQDRPPGR
jgi:hypothetical protein